MLDQLIHTPPAHPGVWLTSRSRLRIRPLWHNGLRCGQAFFDPNDHTLEYHVVPHDRYASFIDAGPLRIDLDASGCPVMVELDMQTAKVRSAELAFPQVNELQRHRFLDFPIQTATPRVEFDNNNLLYHIRLSLRHPVDVWTFAPGSAWEVDGDSCLVGIWIGEVIYDPGLCRRSAWRAGVWRAYRRGRLAEINSLTARLENGWLSPAKIFP
jgi:hypothetical protein